MNLVIVESPAKAKTINKYLGNDYLVLASYGHIRDLPSRNGSVDPDKNFQMEWEIDSFSKKYLTKEERKVLTRRVNNIPKGFYPFKNGNKILYRIFGVLTHIFKSTYKGWGTGDPHLGSRKRSFFWY